MDVKSAREVSFHHGNMVRKLKIKIVPIVKPPVEERAQPMDLDVSSDDELLPETVVEAKMNDPTFPRYKHTIHRVQVRRRRPDGKYCCKLLAFGGRNGLAIFCTRCGVLTSAFSGSLTNLFTCAFEIARMMAMSASTVCGSRPPLCAGKQMAAIVRAMSIGTI